MLVVQCLLLLTIANGAPLVARSLLGKELACPLDAGKRLWDGNPLFGPSKTVRGIIASVVATSIGAVLLGLPLGTGTLIGIFAMLGDLASSFLKRRMAIAPSGMALGLDQIPEALFPLLVIRSQLDLSWIMVIEVVAAFVAVELLLSRLLFRLNIRDRPY
jgi:hypothetical protein